MYGTVLFTILDADSAYKTAVGTDGSGNLKLYPAEAADPGVSKPYSIYTLESTDEDQNKDEQGMTTWNVQIDHYADLQEDIATIDEACYNALNRYSGTVSGINVNSIRGGSALEEWDDDKQELHRLRNFSIKVNP